VKRLENRLKQLDLARKLGVPIFELRAWEMDEKQPTDSEREVLARAFGLSGDTVPNS